MLRLRKRELEAADPSTKQRVCQLIDERGTLFLEAAFRHVSSDYWILSTADDVAEVFEWFEGRSGRTPLYVEPLQELLTKVSPILEVQTSQEGWVSSLTRVLEQHGLVLVVEVEGRPWVVHVLESEEELPELQLPPAATLRAYRSSDVAAKGRRRMTVWVGNSV